MSSKPSLYPFRLIPLFSISSVITLVFIVEYLFVYVSAVLGIILALACAMAIYAVTSLVNLKTEVSEALETMALLFIYVLMVSSLPWFFFGQGFLIPAVYSVVLGICLAYIYQRNIPFERLGFTKTNLLRRALVGSILGVPAGSIEYFILRPTPLYPDFRPTYFFQILLYMMLFVGLGEELLFRSLIQRSLEGAYGDKVGLVLGALIFAIMHLTWRSVPEIIFVFFAGLILGYTFQKTGSLVTPVFMHAINNTVLMAVMPFLPI